MRTSARNTYAGTVEAVVDGAVNAEVILRVNAALVLVAIVTREAVEELGLKAGAKAQALIKSSFVILGREDEMGRTSARNRLTGVIREVKPGAVNTEVVIDLGDQATLTAIVTCKSAEEMQLAAGVRACGLIKDQHVILAVE